MDIIFNTEDPLIMDGDTNNEIWIVTKGSRPTQWYCCDTTMQTTCTLHAETGVTDVVGGARIGKGSLMLFNTHSIYILKRNQSVDIKVFSRESVLDSSEQIICISPFQGSLILLLSDSKLYIWNIATRKVESTVSFKHHFQQQLGPSAQRVKKLSDTSSDVIVSVDENSTIVMLGVPSQIILLNAHTTTVQGSVTAQSSHKIRFAVLTPDGEYVTYATDKRLLFLYRCHDMKLLAKYVMYTDITALSVSRNSWFVVCGTADCRLISLLIADYTVPEHRERIQHVRKTNSCAPKPQVNALIELYNPDFYKEAHYKEEDWSKASSGIIIDLNGLTTKTLGNFDVGQTETEKTQKARVVLKPMADFRAALLICQPEENHLNKQDSETLEHHLNAQDNTVLKHHPSTQDRKVSMEPKRLSGVAKFQNAKVAQTRKYFVTHGHTIFS